MTSGMSFMYWVSIYLALPAHSNPNAKRSGTRGFEMLSVPLR